MKSKIRFSRFSIIVTATVILVLFVGCIVSVHDTATFCTLLAVYLILILLTLFRSPWYVEADADRVTMGSILHKRKIRTDAIESVELFKPTMGAIRICASGGFLGYWGIYREGDIGRYVAFYGKSSDCFLIRMKNGDKYVVGCADPSAMVGYIRDAMKKAR